MWIYGSGFPKSHNISKGIDKKLGAEREMIRKKFSPQQMMMKDGQNERPWQNKAKELGYHETASDEPASPEAKQWNGWGTALKPAHEPIVVARKPIIGTVAENILEHGTGGINIDESRVKHDEPDIERKKMDSPLGMFTNPNREGERGAGPAPEGRFPANVIHDGSDEVLEGFPDTKSGDGKPHHVTRESQSGSMSGKNYAGRTLNTFGDEGSAA